MAVLLTIVRQESMYKTEAMDVRTCIVTRRVAGLATRSIVTHASHAACSHQGDMRTRRLLSTVVIIVSRSWMHLQSVSTGHEASHVLYWCGSIALRTTTSQKSRRRYLPSSRGSRARAYCYEQSSSERLGIRS